MPRGPSKQHDKYTKHVHYAPINDKVEPPPISIDIITPFKFKRHSIIDHTLDHLTMANPADFSSQTPNAAPPIKTFGLQKSRQARAQIVVKDIETLK